MAAPTAPDRGAVRRDLILTTRRWLLVFGIAVLICVGLILFFWFSPKGQTVTISQDGAVLYTINLSQVQEPYTLTVEWDGGYNTIQVTPETVWVAESDCGNQVCVNHGPLAEDGTPIICLPHHLVISWSTS